MYMFYSLEQYGSYTLHMVRLWLGFRLSCWCMYLVICDMVLVIQPTTKNNKKCG